MNNVQRWGNWLEKGVIHNEVFPLSEAGGFGFLGLWLKLYGAKNSILSGTKVQPLDNGNIEYRTSNDE